MKVKKLYDSISAPNHFVVETTEGDFFKFIAVPYRKITEKDLTPLPYFRAIGNNGKEADEWLYKTYGLEK